MRYAIDTFVRHAPELTAAGQPLTQVIIFRIGQAVAAFPDEATAFSHREAEYLFRLNQNIKPSRATGHAALA